MSEHIDFIPSKLEPGMVFHVKAYDEHWELKEINKFENGEEYLKFVVVVGDCVGAEINYYYKSSFINLFKK